MEELYNKFCAYLKSRKKVSANTLQSYKHDIYQFIVFARSSGITDVEQIDAKFIDKYLKTLKKSKLSDATVSRNLSCLRTFFKYLVSSKKITFDPTIGVKIGKVSKKLPSIMSDDEIESLLMQPNPITAKGKRDKAMLEVLYATGMQVSELITLNLHDVNLDLGYIITAQNTKKERLVPLYPLAIKALHDYIEFARPSFYKDEAPSDGLFLNVNGQAMTRQGFWKIIKAYTKSANIKKDITPTTLRHSLATHLLKNGADLKTLKDMLGHSTLTSTKVYTKLLKQEYMSVYEHCHPRARAK